MGVFSVSQVSIGMTCETEEETSEWEFFFDKSKTTDWSQMGISFGVWSEDGEIKASDLPLTFRSGANELF